MNESADGLRRGSKKQIGSDSGRGVYSEEQNQERGHKGAAAHTGRSNEQANAKACEDIGGVGSEVGHHRIGGGPRD